MWENKNWYKYRDANGAGVEPQEHEKFIRLKQKCAKLPPKSKAVKSEKKQKDEDFWYNPQENSKMWQVMKIRKF